MNGVPVGVSRSVPVDTGTDPLGQQSSPKLCGVYRAVRGLSLCIGVTLISWCLWSETVEIASLNALFNSI